MVWGVLSGSRNRSGKPGETRPDTQSTNSITALHAPISMHMKAPHRHPRAAPYCLWLLSTHANKRQQLQRTENNKHKNAPNQPTNPNTSC